MFRQEAERTEGLPIEAMLTPEQVAEGILGWRQKVSATWRWRRTQTSHSSSSARRTFLTARRMAL